MQDIKFPLGTAFKRYSLYTPLKDKYYVNSKLVNCKTVCIEYTHKEKGNIYRVLCEEEVENIGSNWESCMSKRTYVSDNELQKAITDNNGILT